MSVAASQSLRPPPAPPDRQPSITNPWEDVYESDMGLNWRGPIPTNIRQPRAPCATKCPPNMKAEPPDCMCKCVPQECPYPGYFNPGKCACECPKLAWEECPAGRVWDTENCGCKCQFGPTSCQEGQVWNSTNCSCEKPTQCPDDSWLDTDTAKCICNDPLAECCSVKPCPYGKTCSVDGKCDCPDKKELPEVGEACGECGCKNGGTFKCQGPPGNCMAMVPKIVKETVNGKLQCNVPYWYPSLVGLSPSLGGCKQAIANLGQTYAKGGCPGLAPELLWYKGQCKP